MGPVCRDARLLCPARLVQRVAAAYSLMDHEVLADDEVGK